MSLACRRLPSPGTLAGPSSVCALGDRVTPRRGLQSHRGPLATPLTLVTATGPSPRSPHRGWASGRECGTHSIQCVHTESGMNWIRRGVTSPVPSRPPMEAWESRGFQLGCSQGTQEVQVGPLELSRAGGWAVGPAATTLWPKSAGPHERLPRPPTRTLRVTPRLTGGDAEGGASVA